MSTKHLKQCLYLSLVLSVKQADDSRFDKHLLTEIPNLNFSRSSDESLKNVYQDYDLIIYSYIGTGFLESLAINKPNIVISDLNDWPLRANVLNDFKKLKQAGIFFESNEEALIHLNKSDIHPLLKK